MLSFANAYSRLPVALIGALLSSALVVGCSDSSDSPDDPDTTATTEYQADIVWTQYGIPHIRANDWGSLGYGTGYAYSRENFCTLMREYVMSAGDSARYWGDAGDINSDLVMKLYNRDDRVQAMLDSLTDELAANLRGYAAGVNRYLRETGVDNLAEGDEGCRGEPWVREIDQYDVVRLIHRTVLLASGRPLADFIAAADPGRQVAHAMPADKVARDALLANSLSPERLQAIPEFMSVYELGSNAYAVGEQASQTDAGILFGNPHFPWQGSQRFFMFHSTVGDEYDVMGAALAGLPAPVIGFTRYVAWSHTVSTGSRFTFYELTLNPENRFEYLYDGEYRTLEAHAVTAGYLNTAGEVEEREHTFYLSHYGPVVNLGGLSSLLDGWPNAVGSIIAYRDGNLENLRGLDQWLQMGKAKDLGEFKNALRTLGIPWVNTIAADRYGDAFYGDISVVPHVTSAQYESCIRGILQSTVTSAGFLTMDGSDSACEWGSDADTAAGIFGYDSLPKLETREYAANANDSYWLSNPRMPLEGFSPIIGAERIAQSRRTRATFDQAERRLVGSDSFGAPGFNIDNIRAMHYRATNYTAELTLDSIVEVCREDLEDDPLAGISLEQEACTVLSVWDRTHRVDSVGGHIFYELWNALRSTDNLWATPFDPADPVNTPRDVNTGDADVRAAIISSLTVAVNKLSAAGIPLNSPWGDVQFDERNGVRYPIHGGSGDMMFSVITSGFVAGEGYSSIRHGNSYIQAVTWDASNCPDAYAILTYSQSTDPESAHHADATQLYSNGGWIDMPFCEADRDAQEIGRMTIEE